MSTRPLSVRRDPGYTGLSGAFGTLPSPYYFDPAHYRQELSRIWYRHWLYACRSADIASPRSFHTLEVGDQSILLVRGEDGIARAFHNTCRHRGAALCRESSGRLPAAGIVCPYHAWRYNFKGELVQTSSRAHGEGFELKDFPLYSLPVTEWNGFLFTALTPSPPPFSASFDLPLNRLDAWRLADLVVGHRLTKTIGCNWKVFWENYNECLHCPGVHPRLAQLVPIYGRALLERRDDPAWQDHAGDDDPKYGGGLRRGAESWSMDGRPAGVPFPGLSAADRKAGHLYMTSVPSVFIVAHLDYVRVVRLLPQGPERTAMSIEFLFLAETLADPQRDIMRAVEFTDIVMSEDAAICEVNQRGLHALPHTAGVLMPEEYAIRQFQDWVRAEAPRGRRALRARLAWLACPVLVTACFVACSAHAPAGKAASEEAVLHIYNWDDYIAPDTVAQFERASGIKVVYDVFDSNETLESKLMVGDSGYDLVSTSMAWYARQIRAGLYQPLDKTQLPNWKNLDPAVLGIQAQADPGNRYAAPYLHAMNGFAYNVDLVHARLEDAPLDSLDMLFKPEILARLADCGVSFLDSPDDVLELALKYLRLDPNSHRPEDLKAAERLVLAVRPYVRLFDSNDYVYQLASGELCLAMGWSSDYSLAMLRSRAAGLDLHLAFTLPKEGSNITYNAFLIPAGAPHPQAAHRFINFLLDARVIAEITNYTHYGNDNLAARPLVRAEILDDPAIYPPPAVRARLFLPAEFDVSYQRLKTRTWTRIKNGL